MIHVTVPERGEGRGRTQEVSVASQRSPDLCHKPEPNESEKTKTISPPAATLHLCLSLSVSPPSPPSGEGENGGMGEQDRVGVLERQRFK